MSRMPNSVSGSRGGRGGIRSRIATKSKMTFDCLPQSLSIKKD